MAQAAQKQNANELDRLNSLIADVAQETSGERTDVTADTDLERDLGFDSLSRSELLNRVEDEFDVALPDDAFLAETPAALLDHVLSASGRSRLDTSVREDPPAEVEGLPEDAGTLVEVLAWHLAQHADRTHIHGYDDDGSEYTLSYAELDKGARRVAGALLAAGLESQQSVALMLPTGRDYFYSFFGVLLAGGVPVPIYPPARASQLEDHLRRHDGILDNARAFALITAAAVEAVADVLESRVDSLVHVFTAEQLAGGEVAKDLPESAPEDTAFIQYTSGTTGQPKGVVLSHANLLHNIRAMGQRVEACSTDVFVSWLPLYHDMGLIGAWFGSLYHACPLVVMSPLRFMARPQRWLEAIHRHRGTLSAAPNFGYELCLKRIDEQDLEALDLSSWRLAFNGAEPVSPRTLEHFAERFADAGLEYETLSPVYGLAESCVGLCLVPPGRGPVIDRIDRERFVRDGRAERAAEDDDDPLVIAGCGQVLEDHELRIVDDDDQPLEERREGRLQFRGPSATQGYLRNEEKTDDLFHGDWLDSGDRAYLADDEVFITGRSKDLIIRAGRNIHPQELEEAVGDLEGIRKGCVAVFGIADEELEGERLVVVAERRSSATEEDSLSQAIKNAAADIATLPPDDICVVPPHTVLKTSSGKVRRTATAERYEAGTLRRRTLAKWWGWIRMGALAAYARARHLPGGMPGLAYAVYAWLLVGLMTPVLWAGIMVIPGGDRRWRWVRGGLLLLSRLVAMKPRVEAESLPDGAFVVAANHSSYIDALVLSAALKVRPRYVAKLELRRNWLLRLVLDRLGVLFVERMRVEKGEAEASQAEQAARDGDVLAFFPEGTFQLRPGLLSFKMGAFVTAARANVPVVPVTLHGTRDALPADSWYPRRQRLSVKIGQAIKPEGDDWESAIALRDAVREAMLAELDEPDLT